MTMFRRRRHLALATAATVAAISNNYKGGRGAVLVSAAAPGPTSPSPAPIQASGPSPIMRRKKRRSSTKKRSSSSASFPAPVSSISALGKNEAAATSREVQQICTTTKDTENDDKTTDRTSLPTPIRGTERPNICMDPYLASPTPWVRRYLTSTADDMLLPVPREFLADGFNLQGLQQCVERVGRRVAAAEAALRSNDGDATTQTKPNASEAAETTKKPPLFPFYRAALKLILSKKEDGEDDENVDVGVVAAAEALYVLVHARFCVSPRGLDTLRRLMSIPLQTKAAGKVDCNEPVFGRCPRIGCGGMPLLPCGMSDEYCDISDDKGTPNRKAMRYCISCGEMLMPSKPSRVDGSAWGTSLCHLLVMTHGANIFPDHFCSESKNTPKLDLGLDSSGSIGGYSPIPQVFGFPVHRTKAAIKYPLLLQDGK